MIIKRDGMQLFSESNEPYNTTVGTIVSDLFDTELRRPDHYIASRTGSIKRPMRLESKSEYGDYITAAYEPPNSHADTFAKLGLGEYERVLLSCLAWGKYSTYVLVGEMGSGKTTTAKYIAEILQAPRTNVCGTCSVCEPIVIYVDFNAFATTSILRRFRMKLSSSFKAQLRHLFRTVPSLLSDFLGFIGQTANRTAYSEFDEFVRDVVEAKPEWPNLTHNQQFSLLMKFVDGYEPKDDAVRLELLMLLMGFVQKLHRPGPACLVLILDNLDSVIPSAQFDLLVEILRFQEVAKLRTLVPLRRSTFEQLPNHSALSFGIISHLGPHVSDVLRSRVFSALDHCEEHPHFMALEPYHRDALKTRLRFIANDIQSNNSGSEKVLWLAGASLRLGLYMFERVLINSVAPYDRDPQSRDEVLRCAIYGTDEVFDNSNRFVANIFSDPETDGMSMICVRILQFVYAFDKRPGLRRTRNLLSVLSSVNQSWKADVVRKALNYLLSAKRPLLWVDGKTAYSSAKHVVECDDILYLTEAGDNYLRHLLFDIQYLQEMLAALEWSEGSGMPLAVNYGLLNERFNLIRHFIQVIMTHDREEAQRFSLAQAKNKILKDIHVEYISQKLVLRVAETVLNIYRSLQYRSMDVLSASRDWLSAIITCANLSDGREQRKFEHLVRGYEALINELAHPRAPLVGER